MPYTNSLNGSKKTVVASPASMRRKALGQYLESIEEELIARRKPS